MTPPAPPFQQPPPPPPPPPPSPGPPPPGAASEYELRAMEERDYSWIESMCARIYPDEPPYTIEQLAAHHKAFPEGQVVAVKRAGGATVGMLASLIVRWDDYRQDAPWAAFTAGGSFANHDPRHGRTLYAADMMTDPREQHHGIAHMLAMYAVMLVRSHRLLRKRGGSRLPGYHLHSNQLSPHQYVLKVVRGELHDPTLSFHVHQGFQVFGVVKGYLPDDQESCGYAALIEWINPEQTTAQERLEHQKFLIR